MGELGVAANAGDGGAGFVTPASIYGGTSVDGVASCGGRKFGGGNVR
jgi:hypothetical protein